VTISQETINIIVVVTGLVTAVGAVGAAFAAWKSASTAKTVHRRGVRRDILNSANNGLAEMDHIAELIEQMKLGISDLNRMGGSPDRRVITQAEEREQEVFPLAQVATELVGGMIELGKKSDDDLMQELTKMERCLTEARQIRESLEKKVAAIEAEIPLLRQQRKCDCGKTTAVYDCGL